MNTRRDSAAGKVEGRRRARVRVSRRDFMRSVSFKNFAEREAGVILLARSKILAHFAPWLLRRNIHNPWFWRIGWGEDGEEDQPFAKGVVGAMDLALGNEHHF